MDEIPLIGGNASASVVRVGKTVRKPWLPSTPSVATYVEALHAAGVYVPRVVGRDDQGRQIIEFIPGQLAMDAPQLSMAELMRVGRLVRSIHDASAAFRPDAEAYWDTHIPAPGTELICHNDLAPWNLILGQRWVFIDWDAAAPSTRAWDLAYAAQAFTLNDPNQAPDDAAARLAAFVSGYGATTELRAQLPETMVRRTQAMFGLLRESNAEGRQPWAEMFTSGHGEHWARVTEYVGNHRTLWHSVLGHSAD